MIKLFGRSKGMIALVAALQTLVLGYIVFERISLLSHGREVVAEVIPVDPRDIFRGDYVVLGYDFTRVGDIPVSEKIHAGDALYVTLKPGAGEGKWEIAQVSEAYPASVPADHVTLKGLVNWVTPKTDTTPATASVRYGIESYFVPEGTGRDLEDQVRDHKISAVLAVGTRGDNRHQSAYRRRKTHRRRAYFVMLRREGCICGPRSARVDSIRRQFYPIPLRELK